MIKNTETSNGYKIENPQSIIDAENFRLRMSEEYGLSGATPLERTNRLREMPPESVAILIEDINRQIQGSADSLMNHEEVMKIGGTQETIKPEDRYDVFVRLIEDIKNCPPDTNPDRIADALALGIVLLHPFYDGSGRTARVVGMLFRDMYDDVDFSINYKIATEPRDEARKRGGYMIVGYVPHLPEGADRSSPEDASDYLHSLLYSDEEGRYVGTYGQAKLKISDAKQH